MMRLYKKPVDEYYDADGCSICKKGGNTMTKAKTKTVKKAKKIKKTPKK